MDATNLTFPGGRVVYVESLLGRLLRRPTQIQPGGGDTEQWMKIAALQSEGKPIGFSTYRPSDITGRRPWWFEFVNNVGDIDMPPIGIPMGPRHFNVV